MKDLKMLAFSFGVGSALALIISGNSGRNLFQSGLRFTKPYRKRPNHRDEEEMRYI